MRAAVAQDCIKWRKWAEDGCLFSSVSWLRMQCEPLPEATALSAMMDGTLELSAQTYSSSLTLILVTATKR